MFKKYKKNSLRKRIEKNIASRDVSQINAPVKTVGFLIHEAEFNDIEKLYDLYKDLEIPPKDVKVFSFLESRKKLPSLKQNQIYNKDFSIKGDITNLNAREFLDIPFDVLVGYSNKSNTYLNLLITESKAKFKVGLNGCDIRLFDLILDTKTKQVELFKNEFIKYLKILNKI